MPKISRNIDSGYLKGNLKALPVRVLTSNLLGSVLDHVET